MEQLTASAAALGPAMTALAPCQLSYRDGPRRARVGERQFDRPFQSGRLDAPQGGPVVAGGPSLPHPVHARLAHQPHLPTLSTRQTYKPVIEFCKSRKAPEIISERQKVVYLWLRLLYPALSQFTAPDAGQNGGSRTSRSHWSAIMEGNMGGRSRLPS